jgi:DNA-binding HxlR family transcriptional regulator
MRKIRSESARECPCEYALRYIGGAWKILIVAHLVRGKIRRYAEIKRLLRGITAKMLAQQLREMEHDGLIERTVYAQIPPKVEYRLTALGETLLPVLETMYAWGAQTRENASRTKLATRNANAGGSKSQRYSVPVQSTAETCP